MPALPEGRRTLPFGAPAGRFGGTGRGGRLQNWREVTLIIGVYNYTVWLTYLSIASAMTGIMAGLVGGGHPWVSGACLIVCGVLDGFDGKVARSKKDRTEYEKSFGVQLDSLADTVAFGVLPCALMHSMGKLLGPELPRLCWTLFHVVACVYVLAAIIRLANFNVISEEGGQSGYIGLPVTSAAYVYPHILIIQALTHSRFNMMPVGAGFMLLMAYLFLSKRIHVRKMKYRTIAVMAVLGALEICLIIVFCSRGTRYA